MTESDARRVDTVEELIPYIELTGVATYEVSGRRGAAVSEGLEEDDSPMSLEIREQHEPDRIKARFRASLTTDGCELVADVVTTYQFSEPLSLSPAATEGFIERVAVMAAWPFIRESLASTAARLEVPVPLLGLMKQGDFKVDRLVSGSTARSAEA